jgi:[ribosomal protein S5]-alanine N-acetyltransferase
MGVEAPAPALSSRVKRSVITTERLTICELPVGAAGAVARFVSENWDFHRRWEPYREPAYFDRRSARRRLRAVARSNADYAFWLYNRPVRGGFRYTVPIGSITISSVIRGPLQSCYLGYKLDARVLRRGYMREALEGVLTFAFKELNLHRVEANVMPSNKPSLALLRSLGFQEEGLARRYLFIQGHWEDHLHMVLLRDEWES